MTNRLPSEIYQLMQTDPYAFTFSLLAYEEAMKKEQKTASNRYDELKGKIKE